MGRSVKLCMTVLAGLGLAGLAGPALAQEAAIDSGDTAWMLISTALVLMMTIPGLALFYGGMVRKKNVLSVTAGVFAIAALCSVLWFVLGYSLAYGDGGPVNAFVGGLENLFLRGLGFEDGDGIPDSLDVVFQMTFAIITPALIVGAVVDRMKFSALLWFAGLWMLVVYAPVCHWVWGGGYLDDAGILDFAGGTVVHINAGVAGLVAAIMLGRREGYGTQNMAPHNLVYSVIGASLLWVGWFGFNAGSAYAADAAASMAMLVTQISTASAVLSWMVIEWVVAKRPSVLGMVSGAIAGLVAITPAAGYVDPMGALFIGIAAGVLAYIASVPIKKALKYDDALDVWGVHGVAGIVGAILTGVFAVEAIGGTAGALEGNPGQVITQIFGVVGTIVYCAVATFVILLVLKMTIGLRVSRETEIEGLDVNLHGETVHS